MASQCIKAITKFTLNRIWNKPSKRFKRLTKYGEMHKTKKKPIKASMKASKVNWRVLKKA